MTETTQGGDVSSGLRQGYWDAWKGIAIFAVIVIHTCVTNSLVLDSAEGATTLVTRQVVNFAVPIFFWLSGMMAAMSRRPKNLEYIRQRLAGIWPAYLFWTFVFILLLHRSDLADPFLVVSHIFTGTGIDIGYFVIVLSQMIILTPLIARIRSTRSHIAIIVAATLAGKFYTYFAAAGPLPELGRFPYSALPFIVWYPFYHLGYILAGRLNPDETRHRSLGVAAIACAIALLASIAEGVAFSSSRPELALTQLKASSMAYSLAVIAVMLLAYPALKARMPRHLSWIGQNSYIIYLAHLIPLGIVARIAVKLGLPIGTLAHILVVSVTTFGICVCGAIFARWAIPARFRRYVMG